MVHIVNYSLDNKWYDVFIKLIIFLGMELNNVLS